MLEGITSGHDYGMLIVNALREDNDPMMPEDLLDYWCENVYDMAVNSYNDYLTGKTDDFMLTDQDIEKAYDDAGLKYTQDILNSLVDKDMVQASIGKNGDILYSLTDKGRDYTL
jgi:hypothetical protein